MTREDLRVAALNSIKACPNLAVQAGTGTGKTKIALDTICSLNDAKNILIVVAERAHILNWADEMKKWNIHFDNCEIICYASLHKAINREWDAVIFDEAHHLGSDIRLYLYNHLVAKYRIFLSATLKDSLLYCLGNQIGGIKKIKLGLQEAIDSEILPEPKIFLIPLTLDNVNKNQVIVESWGRSTMRKTITCSYIDRWKYLKARKSIPNCTLNIICTAKEKYDYISEQFEYYKKLYMATRRDVVKNKWLQCGSKRKTFLGEIKTDIARNIINSYLKDKRFICFCTSIAQVEELGSNTAIHSKKKDCLSIIQKFNNNKIDSLFAVGMIQEGQNLNNIEAGLIIQLDGQERTFIQRFGRVLRSDSPEQYIIYFKDTRDEEYLNNALEGIDSKYIKIVNI